MPQYDNPNQRQPVQAQLFDLPPAGDIPAGEKARIAQLIANGKSDVAVDMAKQVHKRFANPASEALLVDAYAARVASLEERNLHREAKSLLDSVLQRFPSSAQRLREPAAAAAARDGDVDALLRLWDDPSLPETDRAAAADRIRRDVVDLSAIASSRALAPGHPLGTAAAALAGAFEAVTSGPVEDQALALPEVSRQSPLAPWKLLVRAIAAWYRRDDEQCEKCLAATGPDAAAARLASALRALMGKKKQELTPAALTLVNQAGGSSEALRTALGELDQVLDHKKHQPKALERIRTAVAATKQARPDLLERLKQHISIRCWAAGLDAGRVTLAMDGPSLKNAYFWRLLARAAEQHTGHIGTIPLACRYWEEFRKHALNEKWFPAKGPEAATLYLHMADLAQRLPEEEMESFILMAGRGLTDLSEFYRGQPPEIRALMPAPGKRNFDFLDPGALLERAAEADPCTHNFQRWLNWAKRNRPHDAGRVAGRWRAAHPRDLEPLLYLMDSAERTNALQKAFKLMEEAERLDGLNPDVRKARLRLLVSIALRHLQQKNGRLAGRDLEAIEAMPQAAQGDRPAFVASLRWAGHIVGGANHLAAEARAEVTRLLNSEIAAVVALEGVARAAKLKTAPLEAPGAANGAPIAAAVARACALGDDMGIPFAIPEPLSKRLQKELSKANPSSDPSGLLPLGEAALRAFNFQLAYAVSAAGLEHGGASQARFLFLRTRALPEWEYERKEACCGAASELARRQRDLDLLDRIGRWREDELEMFDPTQKAAVAMSTDQIDRVLQQEKDQAAYPKSVPGRSRRRRCDCPACRAERGEIPEEVADFLDTFGPEALEQALSEILGGGPKPRRGRRRGGFPF